MFSTIIMHSNKVGIKIFAMDDDNENKRGTPVVG